MGQKTVRLEDEYFLRDDGVLMAVQVREDDEAVEADLEGEKETPREPQVREIESFIQVGREVVLGSITNVSPDGDHKPQLFLSKGPLPGNSDHTIKKYHGWRGTTNDQAIYAHGRRRVLQVRTLQRGTVAVTVGPDLDPDED